MPGPRLLIEFPYVCEMVVCVFFVFFFQLYHLFIALNSKLLGFQITNLLLRNVRFLS